MKRNILITAICILSAILVLCGAALIVSQFKEPEPQWIPPATDPTTQPTTQPTETTAAPTETTEAPTEPQNQVYTLTFTGDCTLGTEYGSMSYSGSFVKVVGDNYGYPFENVLDLFQNDDCTFINFEGVLADGGTPAVKRFRFRGPTSYINILTQNSIEVANLANNHAHDFGEEGYKNTRQTMEEAGIFFAGHQECTVITTQSGLKIGMYSINFFMDEADLKKDIAWMREQGAQVIVASMHCGDEGVYAPTAKQQSYAKLFIDNGVDIVWGHHPHVLQRIEKYKDGIIYYSLGNFSFGGNHDPRDKDSVVLQQQIVITPEGEVSLGELKIIPCRLSSKTNYNDFRPTPLEEGTEEYNRVLSKLDGTFDGPDIIPDYKNEPLPTEPTAPTETTTAPTETTTAPTETTEATEETTEATEETTEATEETTEATEETTEATEEPTEATEESTEESSEPE